MGNCGVAQTHTMEYVSKSGFVEVIPTENVTSDKQLLQKMRNSFRRDMVLAFQRTCSQKKIKKANRG
ncbi:hypothetical protein DPMN_169567 [Dreissena polymorpha]|uniref:Uncharacterized protein n=2 Tax=Dreissena polymorpha TaxID=45954 RepID=A0A9D4DX00_DREPO|nr:hypothetical protein DPMN_169567 [Dreissena polymorpha]